MSITVPYLWTIEMFGLPAKQEPKEETLNKRNARRKLLPITSAAGTGRPEEVEKWLKMEADPNRRDPDDPAIVEHLADNTGSGYTQNNRSFSLHTRVSVGY